MRHIGTDTTAQAEHLPANSQLPSVISKELDGCRMARSRCESSISCN